MEIVPFTDVPWFSKLFKDYTSLKSELKECYQFTPTLEGLEESLNTREFPEENRNILQRVLLSQYQNIDGFGNSEVERNVMSLSSSNSFTVTTGQQLHVFLGPLFVFHKIISVINTAKNLSNSNRNVVPVFWMASEDHDFDEVKGVSLFRNKYEWIEESNGAVGRLDTKGIVALIQQIKEDYSSDSKALDILATFESHYVKCSNMADATRAILFELFEKDGLVVIDADNRELKKLLVPVIKKELLEGVVSKQLDSSNSKLKRLGYKSILNPTPNNVFYLSENQRDKINYSDGSYKIGKRELSEGEILQEVGDFPEKFSPNVVLRPVYQEIVLPNISYVAGPAELGYWLQLKEVFNAFAVSFPVVIPRIFAIYLNTKDLKKIEDAELDLKTLFLKEEELRKEMLIKAFEDIESRLRKKDELNEEMLLLSRKHGASFYNAVKEVSGQEKKNTKELRKKMLASPDIGNKVASILKIKEKFFKTPREREVFGIEHIINNDSELLPLRTAVLDKASPQGVIVL